MRQLLRSRAFIFTLTVYCIRRDALTPFYKWIGGYTEFRTLVDTNDLERYAMPTEVEIVRFPPTPARCASADCSCSGKAYVGL
jgi:hypothetical protein